MLTKRKIKRRGRGKGKAPELPPSKLVSIARYARARGKDESQCRKELRAVGLRGRIDPDEADKLLSLASRHASNTGAEESYAEADRRQKWAKAKQEELKLARIQGALVLRKSVEARVFENVRRSRDALLNLPARLSGVLAAESDQARIFIVLTQEIQQALEGLAQQEGEQ